MRGETEPPWTSTLSFSGGAPLNESVDGVAVQVYPNAKRPDWPDAEFIVGNPPFIGGAMLRSRMEPGYVEALWKAHPHMNESADFVMYWWDRAAEQMLRPIYARAGEMRVGESLAEMPRRFGLVTTNSVSQVFQRRVIERHLNAKAPISLVFAVPDHPWTKAGKESAAVRIAMTVGQAGLKEGKVRSVVAEAALDTDDPKLEFATRTGTVSSELTVGPAVSSIGKLSANEGIAHKGMQLNGQGFVLTDAERDHLLARDGDSTATIIRPYVNGRDLSQRSQNRFVIDTFGLSDHDLRTQFPATFSRLFALVKPERDAGREPSRKQFWWLHGRTHRSQRDAVANLSRYVATTRTAKHRLFQFLNVDVVAESKVILIALGEADKLAVLISRIHTTYAFSTGGWLGVGNDHTYNHSECFDPFPFPDPSDAIRATLRDLGEELDATRKTVQAEHPDLTLTGLYNVLEKVRAGTPLDAKDEDVKDRGRVLILKDLHDQIDRATMQAYGWDDLIPLLSLSSSSGKPLAAQTGGPSGAREREPVGDSAASDILPEKIAFGASPGPSFARPKDDEGSPGLRFATPEDDESKKANGSLDEIILERLVALNAERAAEEAAGHVRWLRPDYQIPRFAKGAVAKSGELDLGATVVAIDKGLPAFPKDKGEQVMAIRAVLVASNRPMDAATVARAFKGGGKKIEQRVVQALTTLVRYGEITPLPDGRYLARKAA